VPYVFLLVFRVSDVCSLNCCEFGCQYQCKWLPGKIYVWNDLLCIEWYFKLYWWSGVVVSTLALINEVNLRQTRLVLRWVTVSGSISGAGHLFQYVTNQPPKANSAFHHSGVGKWVPASAGKAKAGMVQSVSGWTRGVQVKLWDPLRTRAIPECLRGAFTTRRYTNPLYLYLYLVSQSGCWYYYVFTCLNALQGICIWWGQCNCSERTSI